jgi:tRNA pseudouridine55 synthase
MNTWQDNSGIFLFDKPYTWTSFDLVNKIRSVFKHSYQTKPKIGHAGTLDPLATGLLIICIGKETKGIESFSKFDKEYLATINLSGTTISYDLEKPIIQQFDTSHVYKADVERILQSLVGEQLQTPPAFSAKWLNGERAYKMARQGITPELKPVPVNIYSLELLQFRLPEITVRISCSKGTYIRAMVRDIGEKISGGAYLTELRRTKIGPYSIEQAIRLDEFEEMLKNQNVANNL